MREALRYLGVLGVIEASANIGGVSTCLLVVVRSIPPSPFIGSRRKGYMNGGSVRSSTSHLRGLGVNNWSSLSPSAVEHGVSHGHRPRESFRPCPEHVLVL